MSKQLEEELQDGSRVGRPEHGGSPVHRNEEDVLHREEAAAGQQRLKGIESTLAQSLRSHIRITLVLHDEGRQLSGFVTSIHAHSREIKLQWAGEWKWIHVDDIAEAYIV
ncbi:YolD-like family protein [Paenibacillus sp. FSL R7-0345]|uniref:YolD-like family protein n=1 Tax=Paenibacillus sp. FSL R7-0345 TaxID=2954535 RepID=UPI00315AF94D